MTAPTLTEFLLARIAEDEADGRKLLRRAQEHELACGEPELLGNRIPGWHDWPAVQDTLARVLAECEAKRRIVESCTMSLAATDEAILGWEAQGDTVLRILASVYADHPDYDEAWSA